MDVHRFQPTALPLALSQCARGLPELILVSQILDSPRSWALGAQWLPRYANSNAGAGLLGYSSLGDN